MITELKLENWKSFVESTLYIDPLTVMIGLNSAGKSNALDALLFLKRAASGISLTTALQGDIGLPGLRGGLEWSSFNQKGGFALSVTVKSSEEGTEYVYRIECAVAEKRCDLVSEHIQRLRFRRIRDGYSKENPYAIYLYKTDPCDLDTPSITARLYNEKGGTKRPSLRTQSILSQLVQQSLRKEIDVGVQEVIAALRSIFILDPISSHMRNFSPLADQLEPDGSNIAGVIAALPFKEQERIEEQLTVYAKQLPEREIVRIYAETVGKFDSDAMLYCDEQWGRSKPSPVDARGMSDGTLRFLAILTALLTRPEQSLLVIEEIDNGLHPSRAKLLLKLLNEIGGKRHIDVLVTTHNPAFLDAAGPNLVPFITVSHRGKKNGASQLTPLENIRQLPKLLAADPVGRLSAEGKIENAIENVN